MKKSLGIFPLKSAAVRKFRRLKVFEILAEEKTPSLKTLENIWRNEFVLKTYSYDLMSKMEITYLVNPL